MEAYNKNHLEKREEELAKLLGFDTQAVESIEARLDEKNTNSPEELYLCGLREEAINTSLSDFYKILKNLNKREGFKELTICDIGASYAKMAFVANHFFPNIRVISIEPVKERIQYGYKQLKNTKHIFINDIFKKEILNHYEIDYVFLYFPVGRVLDEIIQQLNTTVIAIESHGELFNRLGHSFKSKEKLTELTFPRHNPDCFLFTNKGETPLYESLKNFIQERGDVILINDIMPWYADKKDLEYFFDEKDEITIELKIPPRTIYFSNELVCIHSNVLEDHIKELIRKRRAGEKVHGYSIRKIFLNGSFELSSGEIKKAP